MTDEAGAYRPSHQNHSWMVWRAEAAKTFRDPITTEIVPLEKFWVAEKYHQDYFRLNPNAGYCSYVIAPKVRKLEKQIAAEKK